jgi:hypothetical protein
MRVASDVEVDHLPHVHAVDVVGAEHRHDVGLHALDQVDVLVDASAVPWNQAGPCASCGGTT